MKITINSLKLLISQLSKLITFRSLFKVMLLSLILAVLSGIIFSSKGHRDTLVSKLLSTAHSNNIKCTSLTGFYGLWYTLDWSIEFYEQRTSTDNKEGEVVKCNSFSDMYKNIEVHL